VCILVLTYLYEIYHIFWIYTCFPVLYLSERYACELVIWSN